MSIQFNVYVSGVQVQQDLDTDHQMLRMNLGNSDKVGEVQFSLANSTGKYSQLTVSGNATVQIDAVQNGVTLKTIFRGTIERTENEISYNRASVTKVFAYDYGQELLGLLSPDARIPSALTSTGLASILQQSGDAGMAAAQGQDLVLFVSGTNYASGTTVANFMSQFFGTNADFTGSASGQLFGFKPYFSGMVTTGPNGAYRTWYIPDGSPDLNKNYWMPLDSIKVKRQYAWDVLKKITRQSVPIDVNGNKVQFECYIGISGDIHVFTSGSNEFFASGVVLQYYAAGTSGNKLNNLVSANIPLDTTMLKNKIIGWFPAWARYPLDGDSWSDLVAYSGGFWSGNVTQTWGSGVILPSGVFTTVLSGYYPGGTTGFISIMSQQGHWNFQAAGGTEIVGAALTWTYWTIPYIGGSDGSGKALNIFKFSTPSRFIVSGLGNGVPVTLDYQMLAGFNSGAVGTTTNTVWANVKITDLSGNYIIQSGLAHSTNQLPYTSGQWSPQTWIIYTASGTFNSGAGDGSDGKWAASATFPDLSNVASITLGWGAQVSQGGLSHYDFSYIAVDGLQLNFLDPFSPIEIYNSGSIKEYGARYEVFDYPFQTTDLDASGIITSELVSRQAPKQVAQLIVKDNPNQPFSYQLAIKPGQVFIIDAPTLNTGSGKTFYYWRATSVMHQFDTHQGFETWINAYPWHSGLSALTAFSGANIIDYQLQVLDSSANSRRSDYLPVPFAGTY